MSGCREWGDRCVGGGGRRVGGGLSIGKVR